MWVREHLLSTDRRLASVAWDRTPCKQTGLAVGMGITRDSSPRGEGTARGGWLQSLGIEPRSNPVQADRLSGRHGHHPGRLGSNPVQADRHHPRGEGTARGGWLQPLGIEPRASRQSLGIEPRASRGLAVACMGITRGSSPREGRHLPWEASWHRPGLDPMGGEASYC